MQIGELYGKSEIHGNGVAGGGSPGTWTVLFYSSSFFILLHVVFGALNLYTWYIFFLLVNFAFRCRVRSRHTTKHSNSFGSSHVFPWRNSCSDYRLDTRISVFCCCCCCCSAKTREGYYSLRDISAETTSHILSSILSCWLSFSVVAELRIIHVLIHRFVPTEYFFFYSWMVANSLNYDSECGWDVPKGGNAIVPVRHLLSPVVVVFFFFFFVIACQFFPHCDV